MKYNILILILLLCYCKVSHAQLTKPGVIETTKPKTTTAKSKPPIPKPKNNWTKKYDYVDYYLYDGLILIGLNDKYGFADISGNVKVPLIYDEANTFNEGFSLVKLNGKYGFINKTGNQVVPLIYDEAGSIRDGLANVKLDGKWGLIDKTGKVVLPLQYDYVNSYFYEGLTIVELNNKYGYVDRIGNVVIPLIYDNVYNFSQGSASVSLNGKSFSINKKGECVKKCP